MAVFVDNRFPLSFYYRIANKIVKEADVYREEGDSEGLCQALNRYSRIISEIIPHHPGYSVHSNEMLQHKKILQEVAKELENLNSQIAGENVRISRCSTGYYRQSESGSHNSNNGHKDIYHGMFRTKGRTIDRRKHVELICPTATDIMSRYTTFQDFPFNPHFDINVNAVNHYFPSPAISYVEAPPVIGHVSQITFPEPNKLHVEACNESSTSKATKDVHISAGLMEEFMELAKVNTEKDLETCGILGASLKKHTYYINTLVMPKQESTSSSCQALNEEEIHAILDGESLYPAGWIHTHPSQTCFLSSIDLHTQYSYQVMLPEAVAIVMAPTDPERKSGIFRLTVPGGINVVGQCEERGFHPHPETADGGPIYENCSDVFINPNLRFEIFDMRLRSTY
ncbi:AMSH-like ubiquitin thioesterase 2 isoform X1 [Dendrobium catenatum]|uniref:AMSH-like ubiquitin thioesterase 2 n=1 Tax=Dendrobium catenatum TaxID=906689 RepID=A0A2I0WRB2_9ASPA|nr:AMSH-like ubiquitin thioesterase 2 isoform X1 [Dendrobium catenatum]PKU78208.1 AMSH-like ubiquitin thioesterase 2 [Dendrobium catenatum]